MFIFHLNLSLRIKSTVTEHSFRKWIGFTQADLSFKNLLANKIEQNNNGRIFLHSDFSVHDNALEIVLFR